MPYQELAMLLVFIAAFVRGYTGFGFAAIAISGLSLIWPARISVPVILVIDSVASLGLLWGAWAHVERTLLKHLSIGAAVGMPIGLVMLISIPDPVLKFAISVCIILMVLWMLKSKVSLIANSRWVTRSVGLLSGGLTAAASVGGLPVVCYLLMTSHSAQVQRATLVIFLGATGALSLLLMFISNVTSMAIVTPIFLLIIPCVIGIYLGQWAFHFRPPKSFRLIALPILAVLSMTGLYFNGIQIFNP